MILRKLMNLGCIFVHVLCPGYNSTLVLQQSFFFFFFGCGTPQFEPTPLAVGTRIPLTPGPQGNSCSMVFLNYRLSLARGCLIEVLFLSSLRNAGKFFRKIKFLACARYLLSALQSTWYILSLLIPIVEPVWHSYCILRFQIRERRLTVIKYPNQEYVTGRREKWDLNPK